MQTPPHRQRLEIREEGEVTLVIFLDKKILDEQSIDPRQKFLGRMIGVQDDHRAIFLG